MPEVHHLKTWPWFFKSVVAGDKPFELRKDDRGFEEGDVLHLQEWDPETGQYTGREADVGVSYVMRGPGFGIEAGNVVLGLGGGHCEVPVRVLSTTALTSTQPPPVQGQKHAPTSVAGEWMCGRCPYMNCGVICTKCGAPRPVPIDDQVLVTGVRCPCGQEFNSPGYACGDRSPCLLTSGPIAALGDERETTASKPKEQH